MFSGSGLVKLDAFVESVDWGWFRQSLPQHVPRVEPLEVRYIQQYRSRSFDPSAYACDKVCAFPSQAKVCCDSGEATPIVQLRVCERNCDHFVSLHWCNRKSDVVHEQAQSRLETQLHLRHTSGFEKIKVICSKQKNLELASCDGAQLIALVTKVTLNLTPKFVSHDYLQK